MTRPGRWRAAAARARTTGFLRPFAVGLTAIGLAAAAGGAAEPAPVSVDSPRPVERAAPPPIESGDEDHFAAEDAPPPESPAVDLAAGLNEIGDRSPWAGLWGPAIEPLASYEPQSICVPGGRPAVVAFADLLEQAFPASRHLGITRGCDVGRRSEHKEGRAYDWGVRVDAPVEREAAHQMIAWLLATDEHGNDFAMARRLGVMYVIWDDHIWSSTAARDGWRVYTGPNPHTDHVHISFDWSGAMGLTSFWDAAGLEVGPGIFQAFSLDDLPSSFHLGHDRYRRELGPSPGERTAWRDPGAASGGSEPSPTGSAPPADRGGEDQVGATEPAPDPTEPPSLGPDDPATAPTLPLPDSPLEVPLPTTTTTVTVPTVTVPPVDDVVDDVDDTTDPLLGG